MADILEQIFQGELQPSAAAPRDHPKYQKALNASDAAQKALGDTLDMEQKKLLNDILNARAEIAYQESFTLFCEGLRFGMRLMMEALSPDEVGR